MTVKLLVGDVRDRIREIPDGSVDLIATSPPFWNLRDYGGKSKQTAEMGSEDTPAEFLDALLELTQEFRRVLAPHGSIAIELGDSYFGSGGAGGDYNDNGLREGQAKFKQKRSNVLLAKSLTLIPTLYPASLAYGHNLLNPSHTFPRWRIRNIIVWARPNPPVGALGDKVRPATSYITIACTSGKRFFDLDGVRTEAQGRPNCPSNGPKADAREALGIDGNGRYAARIDANPAGAPPLDWWNPLADRIDSALRAAARGEFTQADLFGGEEGTGKKKTQKETAGAKLLRESWMAGEVEHEGAFTLPTKGFKGAHYATWPETLAARLIKMMCPLRVCTTCGEPSRRIVGDAEYVGRNGQPKSDIAWRAHEHDSLAVGAGDRSPGETYRVAPTLGWSDCGHNTWRPGHTLDPFAGSGTTLAVAQGLARDATGIELYEANAELVRQRVGMFLEVA